MNESVTLAGGLLLGFVGSLHCLGMCGGIAGALSVAASRQRRTVLDLSVVHLCFSLGRVASYALAGTLAAAIGAGVAGAIGGHGSIALRAIAGTLLVLLGLYLGGWSSLLTRFERLGGAVWQRILRLVAHLDPGRSLPGAILLGALWGWLPCGLVYSALALAGTTGDPLSGALLMGAFGLGTLPAVLSAGLAASRIPAFVRAASWRRVAGVLVVLFGLWTVATDRWFAPGGGANMPCPLHQSHQP